MNTVSSDLMSTDLLVSQLAELHAHYAHLQRLEGFDGHGPLDQEALPIPTALLASASELREGRISKELDAVRLLLKLLWQGYDAGGTSMGRSFNARIVEAAMLLLGPSVNPLDVSLHGHDLVNRCEERAYALNQVATNGADWDAAVERFRAAHQNRQDVLGGTEV